MADWALAVRGERRRFDMSRDLRYPAPGGKRGRSGSFEVRGCGEGGAERLLQATIGDRRRRVNGAGMAGAVARHA